MFKFKPKSHRYGSKFNRGAIVTFAANPALQKRLRDAAIDAGLSVSEALRQIIDYALDALESEADNEKQK
ncbi:MAG TPA: hypothetical protein G4N96_06270 [Chloroflexi bacterium]|nr:hypothetical protein [Chloroflexota bacterium]